MYKKLISCLTITAISLLPLITLAEEVNDRIIIVNHFKMPLNFIVGLHPETLPDFNTTFTLANDESADSRVLKNEVHAYIRVEDGDKHYAFWGVENTDHVHIHGYLSNGIAYSWSKNRIVFCTPAEYAKNNSC